MKNRRQKQLKLIAAELIYIAIIYKLFIILLINHSATTKIINGERRKGFLMRVHEGRVAEKTRAYEYRVASGGELFPAGSPEGTWPTSICHRKRRIRRAREKKIAVISKPNGDTFQTLLQDKTFRVRVSPTHVPRCGLNPSDFSSPDNIDRKIFIELVRAARVFPTFLRKFARK